MLRTLRWRYCREESKFVKDILTPLAATVAVVLLMLVPGTGCMLYLSLQHTGLLSAALLSFLTVLVGVGFQLYARRVQDLQSAIQLFFFALVFLILDVILLVKVLKSDGQRNAVSATDTEQQTDIINIMPGCMGSVVYPAVLCSGQVCLSTCQTTWKRE